MRGSLAVQKFLFRSPFVDDFFTIFFPFFPVLFLSFFLLQIYKLPMGSWDVFVRTLSILYFFIFLFFFFHAKTSCKTFAGQGVTCSKTS